MWSPYPDPFLRPDSARYSDIVGDGVVHVLRSGGSATVTMRALAQWMKVTPSAMSHRAKWPETVCLIAEAIGARWTQWSIRPLRVGAGPALPMTMAERHGVRTWSVVIEFARSEAALGRPEALAIAQEYARAEEEVLLEWWLARGPRGSAVGFDAFRLLLTGLRLALASDPTFSSSDAVTLLEQSNFSHLNSN